MAGERWRAESWIVVVQGGRVGSCRSGAEQCARPLGTSELLQLDLLGTGFSGPVAPIATTCSFAVQTPFRLIC